MICWAIAVQFFRIGSSADENPMLRICWATLSSGWDALLESSIILHKKRIPIFFNSIEKSDTREVEE